MWLQENKFVIQSCSSKVTFYGELEDLEEILDYSQTNDYNILLIVTC